MKIKYKQKVICPIDGKEVKIIQAEVEHLRPMREDQPFTQFTILGSCGHLFKKSAEEMGAESLSELILNWEPLWKRIWNRIKS